MQRLRRFTIGITLGGGALVGYLAFVGLDSVVQRAAAVAAWALGVVVILVIAEGLADSIGVWASVYPLGRGLSSRESVQFALAGDFFDTLSPAGPVSSEPIMARFIGVATGTTYSEALGVRTVAKYVKSGSQLVVSTVMGLFVLFGGSSPQFIVVTLGSAVVGLLGVGVAVVWSRSVISRVIVTFVTPLVYWISSLYRKNPHDKSVVAAAVDRFWTRILRFRAAPKLVSLIAVGGILEQVLVAVALWTALAGTGTTVALVPIVVIIPLPQIASVVPIPASLGAYDVLLSGALVLMTGAPSAATAAAVFLFRTMGLPFALGAGELSVAFLRGWRP